MNIVPRDRIKTVTLSKSQPHAVVWNICDLHLGTKNCDEALIESAVSFIRSRPNHYWIGNGDYCECILPRDERRFDPRVLADWIAKEDLRDLLPLQQARVVELLKPIADRCLGVGSGNHEESAHKYYGMNVAGGIASALRAPYLDYYGAVPLRLKRKGGASSLLARIIVTHGHTWSTTVGGVAAALERCALNHTGIDAVFMGHAHKNMALPPIQRITLNHDCSDVAGDAVVAIMSGGALKGYQKDVPSYAEKRAYRPTSLGFMGVELSYGRTQTRDGRDSCHVGCRSAQMEV